MYDAFRRRAHLSKVMPLSGLAGAVGGSGISDPPVPQGRRAAAMGLPAGTGDSEGTGDGLPAEDSAPSGGGGGGGGGATNSRFNVDATYVDSSVSCLLHPVKPDRPGGPASPLGTSSRLHHGSPGLDRQHQMQEEAQAGLLVETKHGGEGGLGVP